MEIIVNTENLYNRISNLLKISREQTIRAINTTMVTTYFEIGRLIVEEEQNGKDRATYGKEILKNLSIKLTKEFGKGFSKTNLKQMKSFYLIYKNGQTVSDQFKLSWSHYLILMRMENSNARQFYEIEAINNNWSMRELKRQVNSALYERLLLSKDKKKIIELSQKGQIIEKPSDIVKDSYILEFLGLEERPNYSESELETEIINKLEMFLLELGKGFTFVGRQVRFTFEERHFRVDLVFYNRLLRCFVLIDLKIGEVTHQDLGQMQMYVNYYDREVKLPEENKTIGIIICREKNDTLVKMTLPQDNDQIFASKYEMILPSKDEIKRLIMGENNN